MDEWSSIGEVASSGRVLINWWGCEWWTSSHPLVGLRVVDEYSSIGGVANGGRVLIHWCGCEWWTSAHPFMGLRVVDECSSIDGVCTPVVQHVQKLDKCS